MKYYCVSGGDLFPFDIPKITTRDMRLLQKNYAKKECFLPDAEQNLRTVQCKCAQLAKAFGVCYSTTVCLRSRTACVSIFLPLWNLRREEWEGLQQLRPHLSGIHVYPFRFGLKILFHIKYFGNEENRIEKDLAEIHQKYTDK